MKPKLHYYNIPAQTQVGHPDNPWTMVKMVTKEEDYVVVKLDIDNNPVEVELVRQLLNDDELAQLIDEFIWEHHVNMSPMSFRGWGANPGGSSNGWGTDLASSYRIFVELRQKGIRCANFK